MNFEIFIPIILFLVIGAVIITYIFFHSKEKQMVIERNLDIDVIKEVFKQNEHPYALLKIGIIILFFGLGLGIGLFMEILTGVEEWIPFLIFVGTGLGFIFAFIVSKKYEDHDRELNKDNN